jgi:hypothetical protein
MCMFTKSERRYVQLVTQTTLSGLHAENVVNGHTQKTEITVLNVVA